MTRHIQHIILSIFAIASPSAISLRAQQLAISGHTVDVHGFFSQGFAWSNVNNYLTMKTSKGSAAMTDGGLTISTHLTDRLRVGAQVYSRNIGELGNGRLDLDWGVIDYRASNWLGFRAGKVKTPLGLYTDVQDVDSLHTWALLPQSVYPTDLRSLTIAHIGLDGYGTVDIGRAGSLSYQVYAGRQPGDNRGGYAYGFADGGIPLIRNPKGWTEGLDVRWTPTSAGVTIGTSFKTGQMSYRFLDVDTDTAFQENTDKDSTYSIYGEYIRGMWHVNAEWRRSDNRMNVLGHPYGITEIAHGQRGSFFSAARRLARWLELGAYYSHYRFIPAEVSRLDADTGGSTIRDYVVTARVDPVRHWNIKLESHFIDGFGSLESARGFYLRSNPGGLQQRTNLFIIKTGLSF